MMKTTRFGGSMTMMMLPGLLLVLALLQARHVQSWTVVPTTTTPPRSASLFASSCRASLTSIIAAAASVSSNQSGDNTDEKTTKKGRSGDNKAMRFLRKIGRVGGNTDFTHAVGVDEGTAGKSSMKAGSKFMKKTASAYASCAVTGIIDDISEPFPLTSFGTSWSGFTDQAIVGASSAGGSRLSSMATLSREQDFHGRTANVLSGTVRRVLFNQQPGFIQMATNLANERRGPTTQQQQQQQQGTMESSSSIASIDASAFQGVQLDFCYQANKRDEEDEIEEQREDTSSGPESSFYVHFKTKDCFAEPWSSSLSYRAKFSVEPTEEASAAWTTVQIPWQDFEALDGPTGSTITTTSAATPPPPLDTTSLVRMGIVVAATPPEKGQQSVATGAEKVVLGISSVQFYKE